jgi:hypothetical protein
MKSTALLHHGIAGGEEHKAAIFLNLFSPNQNTHLLDLGCTSIYGFIASVHGRKHSFLGK